MNFVVSYANLIAVALGLPENRDVAQIAEMAETVQADVYVAKKIKVMTPEEEKANAG